MPTEIREGRLTFTFPGDNAASKYDAWSFYRKQFQNAFTGAKGVDIIHIDASRQTWLIEISDYRNHGDVKFSKIGKELDKELGYKVRDTLAGLVAASCNANDSDEKKFAQKALRQNKIKIVLHLELPSRQRHSLFHQNKDIKNLESRIKAKCRSC